MNLDMELQIHEIAAVCDYVQGLYKSPKRLWLSFDEWNVWYRARSGDAVNGRRTFAPTLLEEVYNLEDALLVGGFVNSLLGRSDRVRLACLAQIVNVIAPLVTNKTSVLRQSIYYPYAWALQYAKGRVIDLAIESTRIPSRRRGCAATSRATIRCRSSTWRRPWIRRRPGGGVHPEPRSREPARARPRLAEADADARAGLSDADRGRPEGIQHVRASTARGADRARRAGRRRADDVQAAGTVVHGRADRHQVEGRVAGG